MQSQWECLRPNLGEWHGSFTRFSPQGELIENTPTISLEELQDKRAIHQTVRRLPPNTSNTALEIQDERQYSPLEKDVLFFDNGAFSRGSIQVTPGSEFGAELSLIDRNCRLRIIQEFDRTGRLDKLTLIREKRVGATMVERPALTADDLLGEWQGEAVKIYADGHSSDTYPTKLQFERNNSGQFTQQIAIRGPETHNVRSTARTEGSVLYFDGGPRPYQVLLLPDGASASFPQQVKEVGRLFLEVGWLLQPNLRQRLIRSYNDRGEWTALTLVTERKMKI
jgi:hypothetical protein